MPIIAVLQGNHALEALRLVFLVVEVPALAEGFNLIVDVLKLTQPIECSYFLPFDL